MARKFEAIRTGWIPRRPVGLELLVHRESHDRLVDALFPVVVAKAESYEVDVAKFTRDDFIDCESISGNAGAIEAESAWKLPAEPAEVSRSRDLRPFPLPLSCANHSKDKKRRKNGNWQPDIRSPICGEVEVGLQFLVLRSPFILLRGVPLYFS